MAARTRKTLDVRTLEAWRHWLAEHHDSESEVWLVFHKRHTGLPSIAYGDAVDEALCFGWIDSLITRLADDRFARKFTPRKPDSRWSTINRKRYARLKAEGRLTPAGLERPPTDRSGDLPNIPKVPRYIATELRKHPSAWEFFQSLAPSYRRQYLAWIDSAKQDATRSKRLREAIRRLEARQKPGMK
jgi:uncharacterized protein YdeI (YjbR/CyaY-like superfamily)